MEDRIRNAQPVAQPMGQPIDEPKQISLDVPFREKVSRLFIFRPLWIFILIWPAIALSFWFSLTNFLEFFYMLIMGKRHRSLWENSRKYFVWMTEWHAYFSTFVDKRPKFWWS